MLWPLMVVMRRLLSTGSQGCRFDENHLRLTFRVFSLEELRVPNHNGTDPSQAHGWQLQSGGTGQAQ